MQAWRKGGFINIGFAVHQGARTLRCQGTPPALKWNKKTSVCINIPIWFTVWLRQRRSRQQPRLDCPPSCLEKRQDTEKLCAGASFGQRAKLPLTAAWPSSLCPTHSSRSFQALKETRTGESGPLFSKWKTSIKRKILESGKNGVGTRWSQSSESLDICLYLMFNHFLLRWMEKSRGVTPTPVENRHSSRAHPSAHSVPSCWGTTANSIRPPWWKVDCK